MIKFKSGSIDLNSNIEIHKWKELEMYIYNYKNLNSNIEIHKSVPNMNFEDLSII